MATERQIIANRANSARSTGPTSDDGKARSRFNAIKHGLAATVTAALIASDTDRDLVEERKAKWRVDFRPVGDEQEATFEAMVIDSIRINRCQDAYFALCRQHGDRARLRWDEDRALEAAELAATLHLKPGLIARRLEATMQGVELKIELWLGLGSQLDRSGEWSDPQRSLALDLLGVHRALRDAETPVDPAEGDVAETRKSLVSDEIDRLVGLRDGRLALLDAGDRAMAESTLGAELTRPLQLLDRYERAAARRFDAAFRKLMPSAKSTAPAPPPAPPKPETIQVLPTPSITPPREPNSRVAPQPGLNRQQRRKLAAMERRA